MTLRELMRMAGDYPAVVLAAFVLPVVLAVLVGRLHGKERGGERPWKYIYSVLVYWVCVPGICACVLTVYQMFFRRANLLDVDLIVHALPIVSMVVALVVIRWNVKLDEIPGFNRLSGLMLMLGMSFAVALVVQKTRIWLFFGSSFLTFVAMSVIAFLLIRLGAQRFFKRKTEAEAAFDEALKKAEQGDEQKAGSES